ncbi:Lysosomal Pro-X carboxypeptidase [Aphelenchoides bicaudatus]|nr:Lysosomal Pro-X carboxypeptidase [Aphelenchoides bicaudatus]
MPEQQIQRSQFIIILKNRQTSKQEIRSSIVPAGREGAKTAKEKFNLFDSISPEFKNATIVFVDQRFYGESKKSGITTLADLAPLNMKNIVNDHVTLIKFLAGSDQLNSKNFLVFGNGYGGLIAGYVANYFATTSALADYKVLGWSSSSPIKQIRFQGGTPVNHLDDMTTQFTKIINNDNPACSNAPAKLTSFKDGTTTNEIFLNAYLDPKPVVKAAGANVDPTDDQKELVVYLRKRVLNLLFDNFPFDDSKSGSPKYTPRLINKFCTALSTFPDAGTAPTTKNFNDILMQLGASSTNKLKWKLRTVDASNNQQINQELVVSAYQDCTDQQIAHCANVDTDPFVKSRWNNEKCNDIGAFDTMIEAECKGLFRGFTDLAAFGNFNAKQLKDFPVTLNTQVVSTMNSQSPFASQDTYYANDKGKYAHYWPLALTDSWEFQSPRTCDSDKVKDIRYLTLRAFACLAGLFSDNDNICKEDDTLFDDGKSSAADPDTLQDNCGFAPSVRFPFNGKALFEPPHIEDPNHSSMATVAPPDPTNPSAPTVAPPDPESGQQLQPQPPPQLLHRQQ